MEWEQNNFVIWKTCNNPPAQFFFSIYFVFALMILHCVYWPGGVAAVHHQLMGIIGKS